MDKRLELTPKQMEVINHLENLFEQLEKDDVGIVAYYSWNKITSLSFYNKENVVGSDFWEGEIVRPNSYDIFDKEWLNADFRKLEKEVKDGEELTWYIPKVEDFPSVKMIEYALPSFDTVVLKKNA